MAGPKTRFMSYDARAITYSTGDESSLLARHVARPSVLVIRSFHHIVAALLIVGASGAAVGVAPAATKGTTPCWKTLINDWYDGRIDGIYEIHCYRDALKHLPADLDTYGSARDDIQQALQKRIIESRSGHTSTTGTTTMTTPVGEAGGSGGNGDASGGGSSGGGSSGGGSSGGGSTQGGGAGGSQSASGPINDAINAGKPGSADSLPVPLLVLGGVALALMAAGGAGFLARRSRLRRMQVASAASVPHGPGTDRQEER
jgi:hypothetical protein